MRYVKIIEQQTLDSEKQIPNRKKSEALIRYFSMIYVKTFFQNGIPVDLKILEYNKLITPKYKLNIL